MTTRRGRVWLALVHYPVRDATGAEIAATCSERDLVDLGRLSLVYPVEAAFVVQPLEAQGALVERLIAHGTRADRAHARGHLGRLRLVATLADAVALASDAAGRPVTVVATTARPSDDAVAAATLRARLERGEDALILFGKASGLADHVIAGADARLAPVGGGTGFDHLPVRPAIAIVLDRLLGV